MATPADQRLLELLEKWLKSLELHARYSSLDDDSYWKVQPWVEHQRPSRWIIDLAMQKTIALRNHVQERVKSGDIKYSDSLELMAFLANLVGSEHIERFIPVAQAENERSLVPETPDGAARAAADSATGTREMPKFLAAKRTAQPSGTAQVARTERKASMPAKPAAKPASKHPARLGTSPKAASPSRPAGKPAPNKTAADSSARDGPSDAARAQVVADAARLVQWGRRWYELPELIARMAGRPTLPEVRRILKENKSAIDAKSGGA
ncbi:MAG TPA: hypothetical protein VGO37_02985 [Steroidobacteraceae bacterium]|jgi:hypothetical protein|nr:hypothetical protein [Steroidobacteraceae bacterium]